MRTIATMCAAAALLLLAFAPPAAAAVKEVCLDENDYYCVWMQSGDVCVRAHLGDLEGPYTWCQGLDQPAAAPGCQPVEGHYCVELRDGSLCVTTDTGDLEGPRTTCYPLGKTAGAGMVCTTDLVMAVGACASTSCVVVYTPAPHPVCRQAVPLPPVCTYDLTYLAGACVSNGCIGVRLGMHQDDVCIETTTLA